MIPGSRIGHRVHSAMALEDISVAHTATTSYSLTNGTWSCFLYAISLLFTAGECARYIIAIVNVMAQVLPVYLSAGKLARSAVV
jgi:hypothetical protein